MKRKLIPMLMVLILLIGIAPSFAFAASSSGDVAYLMYANPDWSLSYFGGDAGNGIKATNANITGAGDYTVGLDFTGTKDGAVSGIAFTAIGITTGEFTFPNATIELKSVKINGAEVALAKGYTSSDDGITTRMNLYNEWVGELPYDARSFDGDISTSKAVVVAKDAFASVQTIEVSFTLHLAQAEAYLMYSDTGKDAATISYFNDGKETAGITATKAAINGPGEYTVGLDFTGTTNGSVSGAASGLAFTALGINGGEQNFRGYCITIKSIKVNGADVSLTAKGYTSSDDGKVTRMNIYNSWVTALPVDARSSDGVIDGTNWVIVDPNAFTSVQKVEVTFDYSLPAVQACIMYADSDFANQYFNKPDTDTAGIKATNATVTGAGSYKVALDFSETASKAAADVGFAALVLQGAEKTHPGWLLRIDKIKVNGNDVALLPDTKGYTTSDDGIETRMNIYNGWVNALPTDAQANARSFDGKMDTANWKIVDTAAFVNVKTIEVEFTYVRGKPPVVETKTEIDTTAALAANYNAYFGIQTQNYIFRDSWDHKTNGKGSNVWDALYKGAEQTPYGGTITDAAISGNGTYTVGVTLGDMGLGDDMTMRMLYVSTDIPSQLFDDGLLTISDLKTVMDGGTAQDKFTINTDGDYAHIDILNEYTSTGTEAIPYTMPKKDIMITFTISGFSKDNTAPEPSQTAAPTVEPEATETASSSFLSSPGAIAAFAGGLVVVIGGIIAIIVVLSKKKKTN